MPPRTRLWSLVAAMLLVSPSAASDLDKYDDYVAYGVSMDQPCMLLRYSFASDSVMTIGAITDQHGQSPEAIKSLAWIPAGSDLGFYAAVNDAAADRCHLVSISPFKARAHRYPTDIGAGSILGMVAHFDLDTDRWVLYAIQSDSSGHDATPSVNLITIDPTTGAGTVVIPLPQAWSAYEGLARSPVPKVFYGITGKDPLGNERTGLWKIVPADVNPEDHEQFVGYLPDECRGVNGLEFGFDSGIAPVWQTVADGEVPDDDRATLFGFSAATDTFMTIDTATMETSDLPSTFRTAGVESLALFTRGTDPLFGVLAGD